jgi:hypothetical protein
MKVKQFKTRFEEISIIEIDEIDMNELEGKISNLEEDINNEIESGPLNNKAKLQALLNDIDLYKRENDFYDAEAELDNMFPNRNDEDFDEDSISYENAIQKD